MIRSLLSILLAISAAFVIQSCGSKNQESKLNVYNRDDSISIGRNAGPGQYWTAKITTYDGEGTGRGYGTFTSAAWPTLEEAKAQLKSECDRLFSNNPIFFCLKITGSQDYAYRDFVSSYRTPPTSPAPVESNLAQGPYRSKDNSSIYFYHFGDGKYCLFADELAFKKWIGSGDQVFSNSMPSSVREVCNIQNLPAPVIFSVASSRDKANSPICYDKRAAAHCEWVLNNIEKLPDWWGLINDSAIKDAGGNIGSDYYFERATAHCKYVLNQRGKKSTWNSIDYAGYKDCW